MSLDELKKGSVSELRCLAGSSMKNVINATGVILHTAIGRACLPDKSIEAVYGVAKGYSVLQWDEETGRRGHQWFVRSIVENLTESGRIESRKNDLRCLRIRRIFPRNMQFKWSR